MKQTIISLGRQVGSGGHKIAAALAQRLSLPLYDKNLIAEIAAQRGLDPSVLRQYEEAPKNPLPHPKRPRSEQFRPGWAGRHAVPLFAGKRPPAANPSWSWAAAPTISCGNTRGSSPFSSAAIWRTGWPASSRPTGSPGRRPWTSSAPATSAGPPITASTAPTQWGHGDAYDLTINSSRLGLDGTTDFFGRVPPPPHGEVIHPTQTRRREGSRGGGFFYGACFSRTKTTSGRLLNRKGKRLLPMPRLTTMVVAPWV